MPLNMHQEQVPRKQGLKPGDDTTLSWSKGLHQEQVPRKQGLKPRGVQGIGLKPEASRASSTKTRIETALYTHPPSQNDFASRASSTKTRIETWLLHTTSRQHGPSRASSTKTRIETLTGSMPIYAIANIKSKFHENKD